MKLFTVDQAAGWNQYVKSFCNWDVYYLYEYAISLMLHGDGEPMMLYYEDECARMCYVLMKKDIARCPSFKSRLPFGEYYDCETPYGYGGPLVEGKFAESSQREFACRLRDFCAKNRIISQFIRFHPLLGNHMLFSQVSENRYMRDTIYIDTSSSDKIYADMDSQYRRKVRKAKEADIHIVRRPMNDYEAFFEMYCETMQRHGAAAYYDFKREYFGFLKDALKDNAVIFYAMLDHKHIGGVVFLFNENTMHYHLVGRHWEYQNLTAGNLLIYEAAVWASKNGITRMHLGGGLSENDSLFEYKKKFNKNGQLPFYIGRTIFSRPAYDRLLQIRKQADPEFDENNHFLIQYRR